MLVTDIKLFLKKERAKNINMDAPEQYRNISEEEKEKE